MPCLRSITQVIYELRGCNLYGIVEAFL